MYLYDDKELERYRKESFGRDFRLQRYKRSWRGWTRNSSGKPPWIRNAAVLKRVEIEGCPYGLLRVTEEKCFYGQRGSAAQAVHLRSRR